MMTTPLKPNQLPPGGSWDTEERSEPRGLCSSCGPFKKQTLYSRHSHIVNAVITVCISIKQSVGLLRQERRSRD
ncbi:hypothetical protein F2P81_000252 [Scophthalmus maximus]|uniref:Uncharacterized protein n=1 Tax=Scophthalmus maximus TaxID=52904 RepID=A0A6A4TP38_SCOMX|nr:hypothetical protein F2P81_000252 [Scophthalmus maximus]